MPITIDDIEAVRRHLAELPRNQPRQVTKQEAIALLAADLGAARRRGYKPDDLARLLSEAGIAMNAATLRGYLRRTRKKNRGRGGSKSGTSNPGPDPAVTSPKRSPMHAVVEGADAPKTSVAPVRAVGTGEPVVTGRAAPDQASRVGDGAGTPRK